MIELSKMVKLLLATIIGIFIMSLAGSFNAHLAIGAASGTPDISSTTFSNLNSALDSIQRAVLDVRRAAEILERALNIIRRIGVLAKHFYDIASQAALKAAYVLNDWFTKATGITVSQFGAGLWQMGTQLFDLIFDGVERLLSRIEA